MVMDGKGGVLEEGTLLGSSGEEHCHRCRELPHTLFTPEPGAPASPSQLPMSIVMLSLPHSSHPGQFFPQVAP